MNEPIFSANYNGMQAQLTRIAGSFIAVRAGLHLVESAWMTRTTAPAQDRPARPSPIPRISA